MDGEKMSDTLSKDLVRGELSQKLPDNLVEEEASKNLPEHLVEKIVAMVPFPWIYTARGLSKSWLSRFSPISSQDDEGNKRLATSFQKQVDDNWKRLCPFFISKEISVAYNDASRVWQRIPPLSFFPSSILSRSTVQIEGALAYVYISAFRDAIRKYPFELYVANTLTRSWKKLSPPPHVGFVFYHKFMKLTSETYKVVFLCFCRDENNLSTSLAHIYDAKSDTWTSKNNYVGPTEFTTGIRGAYLDGVLYMVGDKAHSLLAFDMEKLTLQEFGLEIEDPRLMDGQLRLVVCNSNLVMVVRKYPETWLRVLKIDVRSLRVSQVVEGPPAALRAETMRSFEPVSDGKSIFFGLTSCGRRVLAYNMDTDMWRSFPVHVPDTSSDLETEHETHNWIGSSFRVSPVGPLRQIVISNAVKKVFRPRS